MNTDLRQIKDEVAQKHHKKDWVIAKCLFTSDLMFILYEEVIERYAAACVEEQHKEWFKETEKTLVEAGQAIGAMFTKQQVEEACRKTLEKAAERATVEVFNTSFYADPTTSTSMTHPDGSEFHVYKPSITNSKNITIPQI